MKSGGWGFRGWGLGVVGLRGWGWGDGVGVGVAVGVGVGFGVGAWALIRKYG